MAPCLRSISICHPVGVSIDVFEVCLPHSLQELRLEYCLIRDGFGLMNSTSTIHNPSLQAFHEFGNTVYMAGMR